MELLKNRRKIYFIRFMHHSFITEIYFLCPLFTCCSLIGSSNIITLLVIEIFPVYSDFQYFSFARYLNISPLLVISHLLINSTFVRYLITPPLFISCIFQLLVNSTFRPRWSLKCFASARCFGVPPSHVVQIFSNNVY